LRICPYCEKGIGDEFHILFVCEHPIFKQLHDVAIKKISAISNQFKKLSMFEQFLYIFRAADKDIIHIISDWLKKVYSKFKK